MRYETRWVRLVWLAVYGLQAVTGIRGTRDLRGDEVGLGRRTAIDDDRRIMMISNA